MAFPEYADTLTCLLDTVAIHDWEYDDDEYLEHLETREEE